MDALKKFDKFIATEDAHEKEPDAIRSNYDLNPTAPKDRTWRKYNYVLIWLQSAVNVNEFNTGASLIASTGLPYGQVIGACILGIVVACFFTVVNARVGSSYHIGYPTYARAVYGTRLFYFFVFVRLFVAIIWNSVQSYYGSKMLDVMFRCIFGHKWVNLPNHLPESAQITTRGMVAFFLYWLLQMPLMWVHPRQIRWFFTFKSFFTPMALTGLFIFCMIRGHGPGNWDVGAKGVSTLSTGNTWMSVVNTVMGTLSPMIINQPDISRYARNKSDTVLYQAIGFIPSKIVVLLFGMASTCAIYRAYGQAYWNMWDLFDAILDHQWGAGARTGIFFCSLAFMVATAGTNIFANSIPFACDLSGLLPRYFTILRAQILAGVLIWAIVPWKFLANATQFLTFLGSYSIFVAPLLGGLLADYYVLRRGNLHVPSLYTRSPQGAYYYYKGFNLWGLGAWCLSPVLGIPGLYNAYHPGALNKVASEIYSSGWLYTFICGFVLHAALGTIFKTKIYPDQHAETPKTWEYMTETDGFFEEDAPIGGVGYPGSVDYYSERSENDSNDEEKLKVITSIKSTGGLIM
ncbi:nicotinamide riboside transporter 1 [[Candida] jaroonii]|uniref:Nicotinamide riboside transporter 1 n=1 Tax=[Candida] jaroonii TaxID=467808 RepID=A0ACA9YG54_9ASCO|nr:nicotinamide riboside transporter 1 [[Candida] jaroonii]